MKVLTIGALNVSLWRCLGLTLSAPMAPASTTQAALAVWLSCLEDRRFRLHLVYNLNLRGLLSKRSLSACRHLELPAIITCIPERSLDNQDMLFKELEPKIVVASW